MLNNIKISQTTNEIILNVNVIAEMNEILEELQIKLPRLRDFYQTSTIPMRVTGRLFTENEIKKVKAAISAEIPVEIKFDDISDLLGLHAASRLLPCPGYYKQCCDEHWGTRVSCPSGFLSVYAQQWDCWIIGQFYFQFFKESPLFSIVAVLV